MFDNLKDNTKNNLKWKIPLALATSGLAVFVATTRVTDHKHEVIDVIAGSAAGALIAWFIYNLQDNRICKRFYSNKESTDQKLSWEILPVRMSVSYTF
jgi:membrane-associated phospholipid phosphatase